MLHFNCLSGFLIRHWLVFNILYIKDFTRKPQIANRSVWVLISIWGLVQKMNPAIVMGVPNECLLKPKIYGNKIQQEQSPPSCRIELSFSFKETQFTLILSVVVYLHRIRVKKQHILSGSILKKGYLNKYV